MRKLCWWAAKACEIEQMLLLAGFWVLRVVTLGCWCLSTGCCGWNLLVRLGSNFHWETYNGSTEFKDLAEGRRTLSSPHVPVGISQRARQELRKGREPKANPTDEQAGMRWINLWLCTGWDVYIQNEMATDPCTATTVSQGSVDASLSTWPIASCFDLPNFISELEKTEKT